MDVLTIYNPDGSKLLDACLDSSTQDWAIMSENRLQMEFYSEECILLPSGCYVDFDDRRFWLLDEYKPTLESSLEYVYNVKFVGAESLLSVTLMLKTTDGEDNPIFPLTAPAAQHLALIVANLRRRFPDIPWHVGDVIETENIYIEYAGTYCADAIQQIVSGRDAEWWVDDEYGINVGRCELGDLVELGYQKGLIGGVTHSLANNLRSYAYLCPIGSTRNINPEKYGHDRLQLPDGIKLIPMNPEQGIAELAEANAFAGIYPRYIGEVTAVRTEEGTNEDGSKFTIYFIEDAAIPFNPNEYELPGKVKNIAFQSGELMGAEFEVNYDEIAHEFEIITQWPNGGAQLPGGFLVPAVGDKYVVWNISMPDEYYPLAEEEFLTAARKFAQDSVKDASVYRAPVDYIDIQERGLTLRPGQRVRLLSAEYFPSTGYYDSRITRIVRDIRYPNELTVEISTVRAEGTIARLQSAIQQTETQLKQVEQSVGEMPAIITSTSVVQPTDSNVYSALRSNKEFLSKEKGGTVKKKVNFVEGIQFFGRDIVSYNAEKGSWIWHGNLIVEKGLATYSALKEDDVMSVFDGLPIDNDTLQWQETENGKILVAVGGGTGGGLDEDKLQDYLDEKKYVTESWVTGKNYALKSDLDTVSTKLNNFLEGSNSDTIINKWSELEEFLRGLAETDNLAEILSTKFNKTDFTKANIKDKLGIADWALAATNPSYTKAEAFDNFVSRTTAQDIRVVHNFANGIKLFGKSPFSYNATKDTWELDGNLVITKGLATYTKLAGFTNLDVMGGIKVDRTSIYINSDGELAVVGGAGGGLDESALADYLTTNKYATQTWVTNQKYFTQANFTKTKIKETLGISDWALAASKPSYAWSEITSKPSYIFYSANAIVEPDDYRASNVSGYAYGGTGHSGATNGIFASFYANSYTAQMQFNYSSATPYVRVYNNTTSAWSDWKRIAFHSTFEDYVPIDTAKDIAAIHNFVNGVKVGGKQITYDSAKNALVLPFNVIVDGGLATYTKLSGFTNLDVMGGVVTDGTTIHINSAGQLEVIGGTGGGSSVSITGAASTIVSSNLTASRALISNSSGKVAVSAVTSTELGYLDGVTSAIQTQLNNKQATLVSGTNIKTINGTSILGSGNITISGGSGDVDLLNTENIEPASNMTYNVGSASYVYNTGYFQNIQPYRAYALRVYTAASSSSSFIERFRVGSSGKITVAQTSDSQAKEIFNVVGNIYTTGTVTESSARKMKDIDYEGEGISLNVLKKVKVAKWHWKDKRDKKMHIGAVAEDLVEIIPEAVFDTQADDGSTTPSIAYGKAGFSIAASLIAPVSRHEDRIKELEKNIEKMQKELKQLRTA